MTEFSGLVILIGIVLLGQMCKFRAVSRNAGVTDKHMFCTPAGKCVGLTFGCLAVAALV